MMVHIIEPSDFNAIQQKVRDCAERGWESPFTIWVSTSVALRLFLEGTLKEELLMTAVGSITTVEIPMVIADKKCTLIIWETVGKQIKLYDALGNEHE